MTLSGDRKIAKKFDVTLPTERVRLDKAEDGMKKVWISGTLQCIGTEQEDTAGLAFCRFKTVGGEICDAFPVCEVTQLDGNAVLIPALCDELASVGSAENFPVSVQPQYRPHHWGLRQRPPLEVQVESSRLAWP